MVNCEWRSTRAIHDSLFTIHPLPCGSMSDTLLVNEIYLSLQGESTFAGLPCVFVRLTACNLRCSYCDTAYAFTEGRKMLVSAVRDEVLRLGEGFAALGPGGRRLPLVELTGGEPLLQPNALPLMEALCKDGVQEWT